eukprot:TRINITY_DN2442_c0_g2_i1.p1 TRINITY_DN2442_c0_g2~~TRINITY_DN2442_c0_g2_i1.p1  ORF type:complete len:305 (-),score=63.73 TRINITY_DN2442_c0_g2_i1:613-1527(-)
MLRNKQFSYEFNWLNNSIMESLVENGIPSEEIKVSPVRFHKANSVPIQNPLLFNKGSVRLKDKKEAKSFYLALPGIFLLILDGEENPYKKFSQTTYIPNQPLLSPTEDSPSVLSEMDASERFNRLGHIFQLPLFEVHNTMFSLRYERSVTVFNKKKINRKTREPQDSHLSRTWTLHGKKRVNVEDMTTELTPKQHEYFTIMAQFQNNYLNHVLSSNKIYLQYVVMSRQNLDFLNTPQFVKDQELNLSQKEKFKKNTYRYKDKKTLVLDLDETLILVSNRKPIKYDAAVGYCSRDVYTKVSSRER